jgi:hypothetical protein
MQQNPIDSNDKYATRSPPRTESAQIDSVERDVSAKSFLSVPSRHESREASECWPSLNGIASLRRACCITRRTNIRRCIHAYIHGNRGRYANPLTVIPGSSAQVLV